MMAKNEQHPSNRLYNGEARTFLEAVELDRAQAAFEFNRFPDDTTDDNRRAYDAYLAQADRAEALYNEIVAPAVAAAEAKLLAALLVERIDHYADALNRHDFRRLAI